MRSIKKIFVVEKKPRYLQNVKNNLTLYFKVLFNFFKLLKTTPYGK